MMRIEVKGLFKHGRDLYEAGETRVVDDELGAYFVKSGWAREVGAPEVAVSPAPAEVTLDVQSVTHGVGDSNG